MSKIIHYVPEHTILAAQPPTPSASGVKLYRKDDGFWYELDSSGTEKIAFALPQVFSEPAIVTHLDNTNSNTSTQALSKNVNLTAGGDWLFNLSFNYNSDSTTSDLTVYVTFDGSTIDLNNRAADPQGNFQILRQEIKDSASGAGGAITGTGSGQKLNYSMQFLLTGVTAGVKSLIIDVGSEASGAEGSIWNIVGSFIPCSVI